MSLGVRPARPPRPRRASAAPPAGSASAAAYWLSEAGLARALQFRRDFGLRADDDWVRTVAADPAAAAGVTRYSVPLLPAEVSTLDARAATAQAVLAAVKPYEAAHRDVSAGDYIDPKTGQVVVLFTDDIETHAAALRALVNPAAPLDVRSARYSIGALAAVKDRVTSDRAWQRANGFAIWGVGVDEVTNQVLVQVSTRVAAADSILESRYRAAGMLEVVSDGTGVRLMPTGGLKGRVVDASGKSVGGIDVVLVGDIPGAGPSGDIGIETTAAGTFSFAAITAVGYEVERYRQTGDSRVLVGHTHVAVKAGRTTAVTVTVTG